MNKDLFSAVARNDSPAVAGLLQGGVDPNDKDRDGRTILMHAVVDGKSDLINLLIRANANVRLKDKNGNTALHFAAQNYRLSEAAALIEAGAEIDARDNYGNTPLWRAVFGSQGRGNMVTLLLKHGADRNSKNTSNRAPIDLAATIGNYDVMQFFN